MEYLIYLVEDDGDISHLIKVALSKQGYKIQIFENSEMFFAEFIKQKPNMILLDLMLPGIDGSEILKRIRKDEKNDEIDIIIISAKSDILDKVDGLDYGADDYISKPFDVLELISRINAKVRRHQRKKTIIINDIVIDFEKYKCSKEDVDIGLTSKEFEILHMLVKAKGNAISRDEIINQIWGVDIAFETRTVDMHIKSLRQKLGDNDKNIIITIHGVGYKINI